MKKRIICRRCKCQVEFILGLKKVLADIYLDDKSMKVTDVNNIEDLAEFKRGG